MPSSEGNAPQWHAADVNLLDPTGLDQWDEHERRVDSSLYDYADAYISSLEFEVKRLEGELQRLTSHADDSRPQRSSWLTDRDGRKVYVEQPGHTCDGGDDSDFVHVSKADMHAMLKLLKPHRSGRCGGELSEQVRYVSELVDRLKARLQQTSERIQQLEHERGSVFATLGEDDLDKSVVGVVRDRLRQADDQNDALENEVNSLRKNIEKLATEHRRAVQDMYDSTSESNKEVRPISAARKVTASTTTPSARSRRISAPAIGLQKNGGPAQVSRLPLVPTVLSSSPLSSPRTRTKKTSLASAKTSRVSSVNN